MRAGRLDRTIKLQRFTKTWVWLQSGGIWQQKAEWADLATVHATIVQTGGREYLARSAIIEESLMTATIRFRDVTVLDRVIYGNYDRVWNIQEIREIGRRRGLELHCESKGELLNPPPEDENPPDDPEESGS
jgi:head-tail adaptor